MALAAVAALVLMWSGFLKLRNPRPTVLAVDALPGPRIRFRHQDFAGSTVAAIAVWELGIGALTLAFMTTFPALLLGLTAATYAVFTVASARLKVVAPDEPCGCIGASSRPVSAVHVWANAAAALLLAIAAIVV
jgi:hypothetical protein